METIVHYSFCVLQKRKMKERTRRRKKRQNPKQKSLSSTSELVLTLHLSCSYFMMPGYNRIDQGWMGRRGLSTLCVPYTRRGQPSASSTSVRNNGQWPKRVYRWKWSSSGSARNICETWCNGHYPSLCPGRDWRFQIYRAYSASYLRERAEGGRHKAPGPST